MCGSLTFGYFDKLVLIGHSLKSGFKHLRIETSQSVVTQVNVTVITYS